jgi:hypothetical protein
MVDYVVTAKVDSHHTNKRYQCLLIDLRQDPAFHFHIVNGRLVKADLMPTDQFVLDLCYLLSKESPTFRKQLFDLAMSLDVHLEPPRPTASRSSIGGRELWRF